MNLEISLQIETAQMSMQADAAALGTDPAKFTSAFRAEGTTRLNNAMALSTVVSFREGDRAGASARIRLGLTNLRGWLRTGFNGINAIMANTVPQPPGGGLPVISPSDRLMVFDAYGWDGGRLGDFTDARVISLANQAIAAKPEGWADFWFYPQALLDAVSGELAVVIALQSAATTGGRAAAVALRDAAGALLGKWNSRVRDFVSYSSDLLDKNPILASYGHQPRRDAGQAAPPKPLAPAGTPVYQAVPKTLSIAALPQHARSLHAYVQPAGGPARLAGTSLTTTVDLQQIQPLDPHVANTVWLVGYRSDAGEGPPSEAVVIPAIPVSPP